jgi:hypothetical protein
MALPAINENGLPRHAAGGAKSALQLNGSFDVLRGRMPTIEFVSIDCPIIPELPAFRSFSLEAESVLKSHRGLFQHKFSKVSGVIVHLANKVADGSFGGFAGNLIAWNKEHNIALPEADDAWNGEDQLSAFRFESSIVGDLKTLVGILIEASPCKEVWFSTNTQFGPSTTFEENTTLEWFLCQIEGSELFWHCLYKIKNLRIINS